MFHRFVQRIHIQRAVDFYSNMASEHSDNKVMEGEMEEICRSEHGSLSHHRFVDYPLPRQNRPYEVSVQHWWK